ncbi:hypothetical protein AZF08_13165 [Bacillus gaemokensis]|nr:hypothetical protein AZF08_13165 [Bacillus gaemokensis]
MYYGSKGWYVAELKKSGIRYHEGRKLESYRGHSLRGLLWEKLGGEKKKYVSYVGNIKDSNPNIPISYVPKNSILPTVAKFLLDYFYNELIFYLKHDELTIPSFNYERYLLYKYTL